MFRFDDDLRVYLPREAIDFGAGMNTLIAMVEQGMELDTFSRAVFAFRNRKRQAVQLLFYDRAGFCLLTKRLAGAEDRFVWPTQQQSVIDLSDEQLHLLLDGVNVDAVRRHPERRYEYAS